VGDRPRAGYCTACGSPSARLSRACRCPACEFARVEESRRRHRERARERARLLRGTAPKPAPVLADRERCVHCRARKGVPAQRMLCRACYAHRGVRVLYPPPPRAKPEKPEPTAEELDALVASRYATMPPGARDRKGARP
jgi:hypothetical protein